MTNAENQRRRSAAQTHCKRGHEFTPDNTRIHTTTGARVCRQCVKELGRENMRKWRARQKAFRSG